MHFVSLVASERKNGNCDILGRLAVRYALKAGADSGEVVYLKNFDIKECQGCLHCVFNNEECRIGDDLYQLLEILKDADKLFLVAPVYVLTIPGKLKLLLDRFLTIAGAVKDKPEHYALSIGVAGINDWHQFQLPLMNLFLLVLGYRIIDSKIFYGAGPGEVLLGKEMDGFPKQLDRLINHPGGPFQSGISKTCPVDFCSVFERIDDKHYRCPVCLTPAERVENGYYFDARDLNNHRWTRERLKDHFNGWILKTKPRFRAMLREISAKKRELGI